MPRYNSPGDTDILEVLKNLRRDVERLKSSPTIGTPDRIETFTESGTWTKPDGLKVVRVRMVGGGGAGGGAATTATDVSSSGSGGSSGGYSESLIPASELFASSVPTFLGVGSASVTTSSLVTHNPELPEDFEFGDLILILASASTGTPNVPEDYEMLFDSEDVRLFGKLAGFDEIPPDVTCSNGSGVGGHFITQCAAFRSASLTVVDSSLKIKLGGNSLFIEVPALDVTTPGLLALRLGWRTSASAIDNMGPPLGFDLIDDGVSNGSGAGQIWAYQIQAPNEAENIQEDKFSASGFGIATGISRGVTLLIQPKEADIVSIPVTVGAGGVGVSGATGNPGEHSSFGVFVVAPGGNGGFTDSTHLSGFRGGSGAPPRTDPTPVGQITSLGNAGTMTISLNHPAVSGEGRFWGGNGGPSVLGGGGRGAPPGFATHGGEAGSGPGGGGGGAGNRQSHSARPGANGHDGIVIVEEYF